MPSASRIFSRNQYAPVIFWEAAKLRAAGGFATGVSQRHSAFGISTRSAYVGCVKIIILCVLTAVCSLSAGCASKKPKSRYRNYEGDDNPNIRMYTEKPGYPLDTR